jgi:hypothetical protein
VKSIRQIFQFRKELLGEPEVQELVEYAQELEGLVMDKKIEDNYDKEDVLLGIIRDIYSSCKDTLEQDELHERFPNEVDPIEDYKESIVNLKRFISDMCRENRINL